MSGHGEKEGVLIEVKVFGSEPPCVKCKQLEEAARRAADEFPGQVAVAKYSALSPEGKALALAATPALVVNGEIVSQGRIPEQAELMQMYQAELGG
jgi:protein-disulfide isomerase